MYLGTYRDLPTMPSDGISSRFQQVLQHLETGTFQVDCQVYGRANYFNKSSHHLAGTKTSGFYPLAYVVGLALK